MLKKINAVLSGVVMVLAVVVWALFLVLASTVLFKLAVWVLPQ
jgi:hypothetical protein